MQPRTCAAAAEQLLLAAAAQLLRPMISCVSVTQVAWGRFRWPVQLGGGFARAMIDRCLR